MIRPIYETKRDLSNEGEVLKALVEKWGVDAHKLPLHYRLDYALSRNERIYAYIEIKCRTAASSDLSYVILSAMKWRTGRALARDAGVRFILVVRFADGIMYLDCTTREAQHFIDGRRDRGDWQDVEPCVRLPVSLFKPLLKLKSDAGREHHGDMV